MEAPSSAAVEEIPVDAPMLLKSKSPSESTLNESFLAMSLQASSTVSPEATEAPAAMPPTMTTKSQTGSKIVP